MGERFPFQSSSTAESKLEMCPAAVPIRIIFAFTPARAETHHRCCGGAPGHPHLRGEGKVEFKAVIGAPADVGFDWWRIWRPTVLRQLQPIRAIT